MSQSQKTIIGEPLVINGRQLSLSRAVRAGNFIFLTGQVDKDFVNIKAELFSLDGKQRFFVEESENKKMVKDLSIKIGEKLKSESKGSYKR